MNKPKFQFLLDLTNDHVSCKVIGTNKEVVSKLAAIMKIQPELRELIETSVGVLNGYETTEESKAKAS